MEQIGKITSRVIENMERSFEVEIVKKIKKDYPDYIKRMAHELGQSYSWTQRTYNRQKAKK